MAVSFKLRPFQEGAVCDLLRNLKEMKQAWQDYGSMSWTCLKAPTGAGKTVMAGAVIDDLLYPKEGSLFSDKDSVILWVCEKSLLLQSRSKLDRLLESDMPGGGTEIINEASLRSRRMLEKGKVYFIETQLLGAGRRIATATEENGGLTFWDVLENAIEQKIPVYCFVDEAHRGFGSTVSKATIREQIIRNIPFVIGISATEDNFVSSMRATERLDWGVVKVAPQAVRQSGLLKEKVNLYVPERNASGSDKYDPYLVMALKHFHTSRKAWSNYCSKHPIEGGPVVPLMVVQLEAKDSDDASGDQEKGRIGKIVDIVKSELPDLPQGAFAHVLSDTPDLSVGKELIPHVSPERVQTDKFIQILFAKEAISNGWDCPRAEVLYSRARRVDPTYIAQFLGRMMRTPLGREVKGNQELNSVSAMLPLYDEKTVKGIVKYLTENSAEAEEDIVINPVSIPLADPSRVPNSSFEPAIWTGLIKAVRNIQVPISPQNPASPFHLLQDTASLIAESTGALRSRIGETMEDLKEGFHRHVNLESSDNREKRKTFLEEFLKTDYIKVTVDTKMQNVKKGVEDRIEDTPMDIYRKALDTVNVFTADLVKTYLRTHSDIESEKDLIFAGKNEMALGEMKEWAKKEQAKLWNEFTQSVIYEDLSPSGQEKYNKIAGELAQTSGKPHFQPFRLNSCMSEHLEDPGFEKCLYQGEDGLAHFRLNDLETKCLERYLSSDNTIAFFRNPPHGTGAFGILKDDGSRFYPDFIFFEVLHNVIRPYIVDPHGLQFEDSLSRMKGAVKYLKEKTGVFSAWYAIDNEGNSINLSDLSTQTRVLEATSAAALYMH